MEIEGEPWFAAKDVCKALGLYVYGGKVNTADAVSKLGGDECRNVGMDKIHPWPFDARAKRALLVSESGLYKLIMRAHPNVNPKVRAFQDWVTREVLPAIRKDGAYIMGEEKVRTGEMSDLEFLARAQEVAHRVIEQMKEENQKLRAETVP